MTTITSDSSTTLRELLTKTDQALTSLVAQIDTLESKIAGHHERQRALHDQQQGSSQQVSDLAGQVQELQNRLDQARTAASIATGTAAEPPTAAHVTHIEEELRAQQHALEEAAKQHAAKASASQKEQADVNASLSG